MKCFFIFIISLSLTFLFNKKAEAKDNYSIPLISPYPVSANISDTEFSNYPFLVTKNNYYNKAKKYFIHRKRPLHHFLDIGVGATLIESFYPFEMTAYPFFAYINYRRERWGKTKIPVIFSVQYEALFNKNSPHRIHTLVGIRYPNTHDLTPFHVELLSGASLPLKPITKQDGLAMEFRLLFTHIIGPKTSTNRLYFQWGAKARLKQQFQSGLIIQMGLDNHL